MALKPIYNLNLRLLIALVLPPDLRGERMVDWLEALLRPVKELHGQCLDAHRSNLRRASWNPGRRAVEILLNELFDPLGNIRLVNRQISELPEYDFYRKEGRPADYTYFRPDYAHPGQGDPPNESFVQDYSYYRSELDTNEADLIVRLPWYAWTIERRVRNQLAELLIAGVTYELIKTYPFIPAGTTIPTYD